MSDLEKRVEALADKWDRETADEFPGAGAISGHASELRSALLAAPREEPGLGVSDELKNAISCVLEDGDRDATIGAYGSIDWQLGEIVRIISAARPAPADALLREALAAGIVAVKTAIKGDRLPEGKRELLDQWVLDADAALAARPVEAKAEAEKTVGAHAVVCPLCDHHFFLGCDASDRGAPADALRLRSEFVAGWHAHEKWAHDDPSDASFAAAEKAALREGAKEGSHE